MHPQKKNWYRFDGQWQQLVKQKAKSRVKMGPFKIPVSKTFYQSPYGLTLKTNQGYYALRFPANLDIRAAEQWFLMNKAPNWAAFREALSMCAITGTHIVYADREDNIFYLSNGRMPRRNPAYDWQGVLPGDTSATLWTEYYPMDSLPQLLNPPAGYVFNTNNTPYHATGEGDNLPRGSLNPTMGYIETENNRSLRFADLMAPHEKLSYADFIRIKYDLFFEDSLYLYEIENFGDLFQLSPQQYPHLAEALEILNSWDRCTDTSSIGASLFLMTFKELYQIPSKEGRTLLTEAELVAALETGIEHLQTHFGTIRVPWGDIQRHRRGTVDLAVGGAPDVLAAMYAKEGEDGRFYSVAGESYIQLVRFSPTGVEIESINAFGASAKPDSPHYTDQMQLYVQQKRKPMTLDKREILDKAKRIYHPQ